MTINNFFQDGKKEVFDAAVMTMPVPQILQLPGMDTILESELKEKLSNVMYASRYALGLFYDKPINIPNMNRTEYISGDEILVYAANDPGRRDELKENTATSIVFHASARWSLKFLETPIPEVEKIMVDHYKKRYPDWPEPVSVKCQRWRYSQVYKPFEGSPKAIILNEYPLIVAGGDAFVEKYASVDDCLTSAIKVSELIMSKLI